MSSVWLAEDEELGRRVAVKTLAPSADRSRFEREARAAAALSHPNICAVYDYGEADGKPFMVLEYLPNGSLEERLKAGPLADDETMRIATELAAGLAHAHARGLVHRDLKPANVLFDVEGRAKIADFGIARMADNLGLTEAGTVLGTASYISPEQAAGQPAGPASDVYSFGVILFRMLTGRLPFVSTNAMELVRMHRDDEPPAVADVRPDVPPRLESITTAALAKDPADRPADGAALLRELRGDPGDATIVAAPGAFPPPAETDATQVLRPAAAARARRRLPVVPLVIALVVLLGGGVALALALSGGGGGDGSSTQAPPPSLSLPSVPSATTQATTTEATTSRDLDRGHDDCAHDDRAHDHGSAADHDRTGHDPARDDRTRDDAPGDDGPAADDRTGDDSADGDRHDADHDSRGAAPGHDDDRRTVRALYFGTYDRDHPRNLNAIAAMRTAGIDVVERSVAVRGTGVLGVLSVASAETRLLWPRRRAFDIVIVGYPGHFDVPRARRLAGKRPLVFDAVLSLEDELVGVRRRFRPRSAAATVLRVVDTRALRLPDLVVCGTRVEAALPRGPGRQACRGGVPRSRRGAVRRDLVADVSLHRRPLRRPLRRRRASGAGADGRARAGRGARRDRTRAARHRGRARGHRAGQLPRVARDPADGLRRALDRRTRDHRGHGRRARATRRRRVGTARPAGRSGGARGRGHAARRGRRAARAHRRNGQSRLPGAREPARARRALGRAARATRVAREASARGQVGRRHGGGGGVVVTGGGGGAAAVVVFGVVWAGGGVACVVTAGGGAAVVVVVLDVYGWVYVGA